MCFRGHITPIATARMVLRNVNLSRNGGEAERLIAASYGEGQRSLEGQV